MNSSTYKGGNHPSSADIPDERVGEAPYVYSWHRFRPKMFKRTYWLKIRWNFIKDCNGVYRAIRRNNFFKLWMIEVYDRDFKEVTEAARARVAHEVDERVREGLELENRNSFVARYRFNIVAYYPAANLKGKDCHHLDINWSAIQAIRNKGYDVNPAWIYASDDRIENIQVMTPEEHREAHRFHCYDYTHDYRESGGCF